jgi:adenylyltransferase/sulfurtransferase
VIEVRLFATLRDGREKIYVFEPSEVTAGGEILKRLAIGVDEIKIYLINGRHSELDVPINDGDVVSIFPAVGGGEMMLAQKAPVPDDLFARQIPIPGFGTDGQKRLAESSVLVVGAGGLGSPVITYLASAGVGTIIIADGDVVAYSNLNRQFLHTVDDIDANKAKSAVASAGVMNAASSFVVIDEYLADERLEETVALVDCVVDCVDDDEVRRMVGRAGLKANVPLVEAGVREFYGWMLCVDRDHACLECAGLREMTSTDKPAVLGALVGIVGSAQALECLKILLDLPDASFGRLINFDGKRMEVESVALKLEPTCEAHRLFATMDDVRTDEGN